MRFSDRRRGFFPAAWKTNVIFDATRNRIPFFDRAPTFEESPPCISLRENLMMSPALSPPQIFDKGRHAVFQASPLWDS